MNLLLCAPQLTTTHYVFPLFGLMSLNVLFITQSGIQHYGTKQPDRITGSNPFHPIARSINI